MARSFLVIGLIAVLLSTSAPLFAQPAGEKRPYDVMHYDLSLDFRPAFQNKLPWLNGEARIALTITTAATEIKLDQENLLIDSVFLDGVKTTEFSIAKAGLLLIPLTPAQGKVGTEHLVRIDYQRRSNENRGMNFYPKGLFVGLGPANDSVFIEEDLAYTMSEPLDAKLWMPCNNLPYDKATSTIAVTVPAGNKGLSNGELRRVVTNSDSSLTYFWKSEQPIATYLMVADASNFIEWDDYYHRISNPTDSVRVVYFAWPADYHQTEVIDGSKYNAQYAFRKTPKMLRAFSERFGEYPFTQYGQVPVQPFNYGGMEHQTMTTINRVWLRGQSEEGIAHELGHQWFGDKTTCETFDDIWLNESFATFLEEIWVESEYGREAYVNKALRTQDGFFYGSNNLIPIYAPPIENVFNYSTVYEKGAAVLTMLRNLVGDSAFFDAIRSYSEQFAYTTANTSQFQNFLTAKLPEVNIPAFFQQWIYTGGYPIFDLHWAQKGSELRIALDQIQTTGDYTAGAVRLLIAHDFGTIDSVVVPLVERQHLYRLPFLGHADSINIDPFYSVQQATSRPDPTLAVAAPISEKFIVRTSQNAIIAERPVDWQNVSFHLYDVLGREIFASTGSGITTKISTQHLPNGSYLLKTTHEGGPQEVQSIIVAR